jgi:hypothetical protein
MQNQGQLTQQQLQQMQMQRQAMANAHNAAAVNVNPGSYNQAPPSAGGYSMNPTGMNQGVAGAPNVSGAGGQGSSTRAYLDQTVIPILMDGESSSLKKKKRLEYIQSKHTTYCFYIAECLTLHILVNRIE